MKNFMMMDMMEDSMEWPRSATAMRVKHGTIEVLAYVKVTLSQLFNFSTDFDC